MPCVFEPLISGWHHHGQQHAIGDIQDAARDSHSCQPGSLGCQRCSCTLALPSLSFGYRSAPCTCFDSQQSLAVVPLLFTPALPICPLSKMTITNVKKLAKFCTLFLGNGTWLRLTTHQIPDPPATSFANNIPQLNSMWDDTLAHWGRESQLCIQGHPIALIQWPALYKYLGSKQWQGLKAKFFEWKVSPSCLLPASS